MSDLRDNKEILRRQQQAAKRKAMHDERAKSIPDGVDLVGLRDIHLFDQITLPIIGVKVNPEALKSAFFLFVGSFAFLYVTGVPVLVTLVLALGIMVLGLIDKSKKGHDGLVQKEGRLRVQMQKRLRPWVKAQAVGVPHVDRVRFVQARQEYSYREFVKLSPLTFGIDPDLATAKK